MAAKEMATLVFGVSSWLALGGPSRCPRDLRPPETEAHARAFAHVEKSSVRWIRLIGASPDDGALVGSGRRGPAVAAQLESLKQWLAEFPAAGREYGPVAGGPAPMTAVTIRKLDPDRMALPAKGNWDADLGGWPRKAASILI